MRFSQQFQFDCNFIFKIAKRSEFQIYSRFNFFFNKSLTSKANPRLHWKIYQTESQLFDSGLNGVIPSKFYVWEQLAVWHLRISIMCKIPSPEVTKSIYLWYVYWTQCLRHCEREKWKEIVSVRGKNPVLRKANFIEFRFFPIIAKSVRDVNSGKEQNIHVYETKIDYVLFAQIWPSFKHFFC